MPVRRRLLLTPLRPLPADRQIQIALGLFNVSHQAALDPSKRGYWLHQIGNRSNVCGMTPSMGDRPSQWGTFDPYWNFSHPG